MQRALFLLAILLGLTLPASPGEESTQSSLAIGRVEAPDCAPGRTIEITIHGHGFTGGMCVVFPPASGIQVQGPVTVVSASEMRVTVVVAKDAAPGPRDVTVTGPDGKAATLRKGLTIAGGRPTSSPAACLPDRISLATGGAGNRAGGSDAYLYISGRNLPAAPKVELVPPQGVRVVSARLLDPETLLLRVAMDRGCRPGPRQIMLLDATSPAARVATGASVNVMASLTDAEVRALDRQIMRNKWEKYRKHKAAGKTQLAAAWMHGIIRELGLLPGASAGDDGGDKDTSAILFGLEQALKAGADEVGHTPIPTETLNVLLELYKILDALFDPRTKGGKDTIRKKLENMGITGDEALDMIDELEAVWKGLGRTVKK